MTSLVESPESEWWRGEEVSSRDEALRVAMERAAAELTELLGEDVAAWRWGDLHTLTVRNASFGESGIAAVEWLFNRGPVATGGGSSVVNATGWDPAQGYEVTTVPSMRMVVDLADVDNSQWINLTGNSGHAFHPHYADQLELWAAGTMLPMRMTRSAVEEAAEHTLVLRP